MNVNVIDLDGTLIAYDSYTYYIKQLIKSGEFAIAARLLIYLRKFRIISVYRQKKYSITLCRKTSDYQSFLKQFAQQIFDDIDKSVLEIVKKHSSESTTNVLCTASPIDYASIVADFLGWDCIASSLDTPGNRLNHVYKNNKITMIQKQYPAERYNYNFAISDSPKDVGLLKQFKHAFLFRDGHAKKI